VRKTILLATLVAAPLAARAQEAAGNAAPRPAEVVAAPAAGVPVPLVATADAPAAPAPAPAPTKHGIFPLWGDKVRAKGFDLPEPFGFMVNYYNQKSDIEITNLKLGFNGGPMFDASGLVKIPGARTEASALAIRPNVMVFPFLSVYAVFSVGDTQTNVQISEVLGQPVDYSTVAKSGAQVLSLGATFQMGYKGFFAVADFNGSVSDVDRLADTVGANMLSFRLGYNKKLNARGRGLAVWAGTAGQVLEVETKGSVRLGDVVPPPSQDTIAGIQAQCDALPLLDPKRVACNRLVDRLQNYDGNATVEYSLDKKPAGVWNMILGAQFAIDRAWQLRFESTFLNGRTTYLGAVEYRFDYL
jgi:hypothetical protein